MRFSQVSGIRIPKGSAKAIRYKGETLWDYIRARYVSLGDSIAAGHMITDDWEKDYGRESQYWNKIGENTFRTEPTVIIPNTYTDLIHKDLKKRYRGTVNATSFAQSGDTVATLMEKLDHTVVRNAIAKANYVTVCIGANDALTPCLENLDRYINGGAAVLDEIAAIIENNLAVLNDDSNGRSYTALFNKLAAINPNAKYVFTTIYNPYKYLWLEEGTDGFFKPMLDTIPQMTILGWEIDEDIKNSLLSNSTVQLLFDRVNGLCDWAEIRVNRINEILRNKVVAYQAINPNFLLAETKAVFDTYPDRPVPADVHYNDLVNVEYTRGYNTALMNWGRLWNSVGKTREQFWKDLAWKHVSWSGFDVDGFWNEAVALTIEKVIVPDVDPHPEEYGHIVLKRVFEDELGI